MVKKDYTEYNRDQKNFEKKPLSKDFKKLIFPPESDVKKSEDHDPSVLPTSKLSMRKTAQKTNILDLLPLYDFTPKGYQLYEKAAEEDWFEDEDYQNPNLVKGKWTLFMEVLANIVESEGAESVKYPTSDLENAIHNLLSGGYIKGEKESSIKLNPKTSAWGNLPRGWTEKSLRSFWNSLGGKGEHKVTKCIEKMEDKVDNPGAFCASLERRIESSNLEGKKLAVGDKILTSTKKKAKVVKVGTELAFWMSDEGGEKDFGSDFVEDIELIGPVESTVPVEGGLTKEVPLEEKTDLGEKI